MKKPHVLIIENSSAVTGALKSILRSSNCLSDQYDFSFILPKHSTAKSTVEAMGFTVYEFPMKELRKSVVSLLLYFPFLFFNTLRLFRLIRVLKIDLINVNDFYNLLPAAYRLLGGRVAYVCYVRFLPSKFPQVLVKFWCYLHNRYASSIIAVSEAVRKELPYHNKVEVIANELPAEKIVFTPSTTSYILYPANYIQGKGQEYALESFARIHHKYPYWKLRFVGGDMGLEKNKNFKASLNIMATTLDIQGQVEWLGFSEDIRQEYLNAAIVLNFSESESFSLTCLEGMFYGRAVIATKSGGPSEIIDDGISGMLVELKDINGMAKAMEHLIAHEREREDMSQQAFKRVREKYSITNTTFKLGALYKGLTQN